jgi:hypothetical protein
MYKQDPAAPKVFSSKIYILDVTTGVWKEGPSATLPRVYAACTLVGNQFVAWGGLQDQTVLATGPLIVFDVRLNQWVTKYTALSEQIPRSPSNDSTGPPDTTTQGSGGSSNLALILGGALGGLFVVAFAGALLFYRKRKADKARREPCKSQHSEQDNLGDTHPHHSPLPQSKGLSPRGPQSDVLSPEDDLSSKERGPQVNQPAARSPQGQYHGGVSGLQYDPPARNPQGQYIP